MVDHILRQRRRCFAVPEIARRGTNQLCDLMAVLKLGTINFDHRVRGAEEDFGSSFNHAGLS